VLSHTCSFYFPLKEDYIVRMIITLCCLIQRYTNGVEADEQDETGWKNIHGDVFRFPENKSLFAACIGSGTQLLTLYVFSDLALKCVEFAQLIVSHKY